MGLEPLIAGDPREVAGYRLRARLGAGGMGQVYLAFTAGGRPVALKVMHPQLAGDSAFHRRFEREVAAARRVHGLYTAQVLDADPAATPPWMVTAYVPGPSLREAVNGYGPMPARTVLILMAGVAEALQVIHAAGVIHRDLKPSNVLLAPDGPRVIDFGIARATEDTEVTGTGSRIGSPHYMAPEQVAGEPVAGATDVFALGALAVYAATGRPVFGEGPDLAVMYRVRHGTANLGGCQPELRPIAERCLAKNPEDRPSPAEVLAWCRTHTAGRTQEIARPWLPPALAGALAGHVPPPPGPPPPGTPPPGSPTAAPPPPSPHPRGRARTPRTQPAAVPPLTVPTKPASAPRHHPLAGAPRRRQRRSPARRLRAGAGILAAIVAFAWLLAHHPAGLHAGTPTSSSAPPPTSWLAGAWVGPADQPTGTVTHWTAELRFPSQGRSGTFRFLTLGCSGRLTVTSITRTTASVREHVTHDQRKVCAPDGLIKLTRLGARSMNMAWQDSTDRGNVASARLSPAR